MARRSPSGGTLSKRKSDGMWIGGYTVHVDGRSVKKVVSHKTRNGAITKKCELKKRFDAGVVLGATDIRMDRGLINVKKPRVDPTTFRSYERTVRLYTPRVR